MAAEQDALMAAAACWRCMDATQAAAVTIYETVTIANDGEPPGSEWFFGDPGEDWIFGDPGADWGFGGT